MTPIFSEFIVYDGFYGSEKFRFLNCISCEINKDIMEIGEANFKIETMKWFQPLDRIKIIAVYREKEQQLFDGFISEIVANKDFLEIKLLDFKQILERKINTLDLQNKTSASSLLTQAVNSWNTLSGENISINLENDITGKFSASPWDSLMSVITGAIGENFGIFFDIDKKQIILKKILWVRKNGIYTYSMYHTDSTISEISATVTENLYTNTYDTENKKLASLEFPVSKYGVMVSTSDNDRMSNNYGINREFNIVIHDPELQAGDIVTLEIIGGKYNEQIIESGWSRSREMIVWDYISYYGDGYVLREKILIENGFIAKTLEIGTKIKKQKTITDILLQAVR